MKIKKKKITLSPDDKKGDYQYLNLHFIIHNSICREVNEEFKRCFPNDVWRHKNIREWNVSEESVEIINETLLTRNCIKKALSIDEVRTIRAGVPTEVETVKTIKINDTYFCTIAADGDYLTTNAYIRYRRIKTSNNNDMEFKWAYAKIIQIYIARPYNDPSIKREIVVRVKNFTNGRSDAKNGIITLVARSDKNCVHDKKGFTIIVPVKDIDDQNFEFWNDGQSRTNFSPVHTNPVRKEADPSRFIV